MLGDDAGSRFAAGLVHGVWYAPFALMLLASLMVAGLIGSDVTGGLGWFALQPPTLVDRPGAEAAPLASPPAS